MKLIIGKKLNKFQAIGVAAIVLLLSSCASPYNMHSPITKETVVKPEEGIVVARIIDASGSWLPFNELTLNPENVNQSKKIKPDKLVSLTPQINGVTVFASALKAGNYALDDLSASYRRGDYSYWRFIPVSAQFGTFTVKPGEITDLGTLIYYPKPKGEMFLHSVVRLPSADLEKAINRFFPFYDFNAEKVNTWADDGKDDERFELYANIAQNPTTFGTRYKSPDNGVYFLAKLGVIVHRSSLGEWAIDAVDTNYQLNTVAENAAGDLVVGGPEGVLFIKQRGKEWQNHSFDKPVNVLKATFNQQGQLDVLIAEDLEMIVLRAQGQLDAPQWEEVNRYNHRDKWKKNDAQVTEEKTGKKKVARKKLITHVRLHEEAGKHLVSINYVSRLSDAIFSNGDVETFEYNPTTWVASEEAIETKWEVMFTSGAAKMALEKAGFWSLNWRSDYFKYDPTAKEWIEITDEVFKCGDKIVRPDFVCDVEGKKTNGDWISFNSAPWFKNDKEGIAIVTFNDTDFWTGKTKKEIKVLVTDDGGKVWLDSGNTVPKPYCKDVVSEIKDALVVSCDGATGDFYQSEDFGKTWKLVRQHANF